MNIKIKNLIIIFVLIGTILYFLSVIVFITQYINRDFSQKNSIIRKLENNELSYESKLNLYGIPEDTIIACKFDNQAVSYESEFYPTLDYDNVIIGVGELSITEDITNDRVYILSKDECSIKIIEHSLSYRPISSLEKISEYVFAFTYTAQPHYGHYLEYNLEGNQLDTYPLADECYMVNQVPENLKSNYEEKCKINPQLKPFF